MESPGGSVSALGGVFSAAGRLGIDVTIAASSTAHAEEIVTSCAPSTC